MNEQARGQAVRRILDVAFPDLPPAGCVGTAMALDNVASWARAELHRLPELAAISSGMKHNAGVAELAEVVFASRPTADPHEVVFGLPGARIGSGEYVQSFVTASTDGRPARYFDGLPDWLHEHGALRHINGFAAEYEPDYGLLSHCRRASAGRRAPSKLKCDPTTTRSSRATKRLARER